MFGVPVELALVNRLQVSRRLYALLRTARVPQETILRRTPLTPMRMIWMPEDDVVRLVAELGGELLDRERPPDVPGYVRFWVAPAI